jgi:methyl-accepting chemotaxis protein
MKSTLLDSKKLGHHPNSICRELKEILMFGKIRNATVSGRQWLLTGQFLLSLLLSGALSWWIINSLGEQVDQLVKADFPAVKHSTLLDMEHDGLSGGVFRAIYAVNGGDTTAIQSLEDQIKESEVRIETHLKELEAIDFKEPLRSHVREARGPFAKYIEQAKAMLSHLKAKDNTSLEAGSKEFYQTFDEVKAIMDRNNAEVAALASSIESTATAIQSQAKLINTTATLASILILLLLSFLIIRTLNRDLGRVVNGLRDQSTNLTSVAQQFSNNASTLASTSTEQTAALQETAATLDEISAMMKRTEDNSRSLAETSEQSQKSALQGKSSIVEMTQSIASIQESFELLSKQVNESNSQFREVVNVIKNIGTKTKVINDIVFQTKLLSFNASVEAARAGEHGKGFAVVAQEIGNLASMSGNAAHEISEMLSISVDRVEGIVSNNRREIESLMNDGRQKVDQGTVVSQQTEASLQEIIEQSWAVNQMVNEINSSISEQSRGIHEIVAAVNLLNNSTSEISRTSESGAAGSRNLLSKTEALNQHMHRLENLVSNFDDKVDVSKPQLDRLSGNSIGPGPANVISFSKKAALKKPQKTAAPKPKAPTASPKKPDAAALEVHDYGTNVKIPLASDPRFEEV